MELTTTGAHSDPRALMAVRCGAGRWLTFMAAWLLLAAGALKGPEHPRGLLLSQTARCLRRL